MAGRPLPSTSGTQSNKTNEHVISDNEEDIDDLMEEKNGRDNSNNEEFDMLGDLENFFEGQDDTDLEVQVRIAKVTERALRGEIIKKDEEKLQALKEKHRWPANIANMQIPKIEQFIWRHRKRVSNFVQIKD